MNLYRHVLALAGKIGPRPSASKGEAEAAAYVRVVLETQGIGTTEDIFHSVDTFSWSQLFIYVSALLSFGLTWFVPWLGMILGLVVFFLFVGEIDTGFPVVSGLLATRKSRNVLGTLSAGQQKRGLVVVSAHLDSSRSSAAFAPGQVRFFRATFWGAALSLLILPVMTAVSFFVRGVWLAGLPFAAYLVVATFLLLQREFFYRVVPGANDNASGVAVLLGVAEELVQAPMENLEVWLLATGSEEAGLVGMLHFWRSHAAQLAGAYFLNLDNLGRGELCWTTAEGMLFPRRTSPALVRTAQAVAGELGIATRGRSYLTMSTDAQVPLARGGEAMSIMALDPRGIPPDWHWESDVPERVEEKNLEDACRLAAGILRQVDREMGKS